MEYVPLNYGKKGKEILIPAFPYSFKNHEEVIKVFPRVIDIENRWDIYKVWMHVEKKCEYFTWKHKIASSVKALRGEDEGVVHHWMAEKNG